MCASVMKGMEQQERINLDVPRYDQSEFRGRLKHFLGITDWRLCFKGDEELNQAKELLHKYRLHQEPPGTSEEKIWQAKRLYESAFHPDTGEKQNLIGRMSFQVPGGMMLTGAMMTFYKSTPAVVFWQWANQSFNALVNYTNRNAKSPLSVEQMGFAYVSATGAALVTALGLKTYLGSRASTLVQRYVPFAAVAAANCINVPLMRQAELMNGIVVCDANGNELVNSKLAAAKGISQVTFSRIFMAAPGMTILPVIMERLEKQNWLRNNPRLNAPFQMLMCGAILTIMTPTACAVFDQKCSISTSTLSKMEPKAYSELEKKFSGNVPDVVYFNKGL
ncbi:sideroflexin-2-like isoform X1 [Eriocheir sinensis]|uniref:sideroflexin-2-like isoform X1 n=2 Tax=Eriocheir sinensis TaxID=95602 RepID=UPI0021C83CAA|nr:sideroflexin-2-like isoform X1 [Eriocheir sinensis]